MLVAYKKQHRHPRVPKAAPDPWTELGLWVDHIRALKRNDHLSAERQAQLDKLDFCWRVDGQTLDNTDGLLNEDEFRTASGLTQIERYRKRGLITPIGTGVISFFYHPRQITELKNVLGITLNNTEGLLTEDEFIRASGLPSISKYRKRGLITPVGYGLTSGGKSPFYHHRQIAELKKTLGITLDSTEGLMNEKEFIRTSRLTHTAEYRKRGLITPVGYAVTGGSSISPFYHLRQIAELKSALGITLDTTEGLLNEQDFIQASGLTQIAPYRKQQLIKPVGFAMNGSHLSAFYHHRPGPARTLGGYGEMGC